MHRRLAILAALGWACGDDVIIARGDPADGGAGGVPAEGGAGGDGGDGGVPNGGTGGEPEEPARVRLRHAAAAPALALRAGNRTVAPSVAPRDGSAWAEVPAGAARVLVGPAEGGDALADLDVTLGESGEHTVLALGDPPQLQLIEEDRRPLAPGTARLLVINALAAPVDLDLIGAARTRWVTDLAFAERQPRLLTPAGQRLGLDIDRDADLDFTFALPVSAGQYVNAVLTPGDPAPFLSLQPREGPVTIVEGRPYVALVRTAHLYAGAPDLTTYVDDGTRPAIRALQHAFASDYVRVDAGARRLLFATRDGPFAETLEDFPDDTRSTVAVIRGRHVPRTIVVRDDPAPAAPNTVRLRVAHASGRLGRVNAVFAGDAPVTLAEGLALAEVSAPREVPLRAFTLELHTNNDEVADVRFAVPQLLNTGVYTLFFTVDGLDPVLFAVDGEGRVLRIVGEGEARLRILHLSREGGPANVFMGDPRRLVGEALSLGRSSEVLTLPPRVEEVLLAYSDRPFNGPLIGGPISLEAGEQAVLAVLGAPFEPHMYLDLHLVTPDRFWPGQAQLRFVNAVRGLAPELRLSWFGGPPLNTADAVVASSFGFREESRIITVNHGVDVLVTLDTDGDPLNIEGSYWIPALPEDEFVMVFLAEDAEPGTYALHLVRSDLTHDVIPNDLP